MEKLVLIFIGLLTYINGLAQDNTARLTTIIGSHIEFNFNTLDNYTDGIRIVNGTTIGIAMSEIPPAILTGWHIDVQTFSGQATLNGFGGTTLPLNTIQVEATDANGNLAGAIFTGLQDLAIAPGNLLMSTTNPAHLPADPTTHQINLSYECGIANGSLLGSTAGCYTVEVEVILIPDF